MEYFFEEYNDYLYIDKNPEYLSKKKEEGKSVLLIEVDEEINQDTDFSVYTDLRNTNLGNTNLGNTKEKYVFDDILFLDKEDLNHLQDLLNETEMKEYLYTSYCRQQEIPITIIQNEELRIREFASIDLKRICEIYESEEGKRFLEPFYKDFDEASVYLNNYIENRYPVDAYCLWGVERISASSIFVPKWRKEKETISTMIGIVGLVQDGKSEEDTLELKFALHPEAFRKGYGEKMCRLALEYARNRQEFHHVKAYFDKENERSRKLLFKLGFQVRENSASLEILW